MPSHVRRLAASLWTLAAALGCQSVGDPGDLKPDSLLKAAESSPGAVTLDIYWARTRADDVEFEQALWRSVQEDRLPVELRQALAAHGLRAGVVGGNPSPEVGRLLNPDDVDLEAQQAESQQTVDATPNKVSRRLLQLKPGRRAEIPVAESGRTMQLLRRQQGGLVGQRFEDAQGVYALHVTDQGPGQVAIELTPELHHGQPRMRYTPSGPGMVVQQLARDREVFDELRTSVRLAPGEMLLVSCLSDTPHRLGSLLHRFESEQGAGQKYLLVRLSQVPDHHRLASSRDSAWPWE